ncbi:hypothetical protein Krac_11914 [Ktedonobacter racemifer DSM 44963]|uniref:Uncharacterized protein n=1 Tax=Ktedonobacter racemifer DSM 44963 TaxID=485913 RepID=D6TEC5_KTERA|nr:hypothetical protein Krac_11914 [Ktedonobacter racemifer DSM 44963]
MQLRLNVAYSQAGIYKICTMKALLQPQYWPSFLSKDANINLLDWLHKLLEPRLS